MTDHTSETTQFELPRDRRTAHNILMTVYNAMREKGYDPVNQIIGYLLSGDPTYITSYNNARYLIRGVDRDELVEELVRYYVENNSLE